ncbi:hypothetical protein ACFYP4_02705 [Streptomyces sp. NPDC005551]|uniref:hypothetical protein n=1 Tax=Streptomyces sp. NPDC005551 TaxID=3364725 RepID=UPI0036946200
MAAAITTSRQALLQRGWYVVTDVQTAYLGLSGKAHDLLIILKHKQGDNANAVPTHGELASILGWSVRTVARVLDELTAKKALAAKRTGRANSYRVNYVHGSVDELRVLLGGELEIPQELVTSDRTTVGRSDVTDSGVSLPYKEPLQNQPKNNTLPSGGDAAAASQPETPLEDEMALNGSRPHGFIADEMDPAANLGLWDSQEATEGAQEGLDGLFPAQDVSGATEARQKPARTQKQLDAPMALASEFDAMVRQQPWAGPSPVNRAALAKNLSTWKRDGLTADQIRAMMTKFTSPDYPRKSQKAPWIDFLAQRHKLLAFAERAQTASALEEHRHDGADYWLGSMASGR